MRNLTRKTTFSRVLHMAAPDTTSAEWIAEAPSACTTSGTNCRQAPLTNFGTVRFSQSSLTDSNGHTGTISDPAWSPTALTLQSDIAGPDLRPVPHTRHTRPRHAECPRRSRRGLHRQVEHRNRCHDRPWLRVRRLRVRRLRPVAPRFEPSGIFHARSNNFSSTRPCGHGRTRTTVPPASSRSASRSKLLLRARRGRPQGRRPKVSGGGGRKRHRLDAYSRGSTFGSPPWAPSPTSFGRAVGGSAASGGSRFGWAAGAVVRSWSVGRWLL